MSEFLTVIKEYERLCNNYFCSECTYKEALKRHGISDDILNENPCMWFVAACPEESEKIIMDWSKKHPRKTMLETFMDSIPEAVQTPNGTFRLCPAHVNPNWSNLCSGDGKGNCRACWGREV